MNKEGTFTYMDLYCELIYTSRVKYQISLVKSNKTGSVGLKSMDLF